MSNSVPKLLINPLGEINNNSKNTVIDKISNLLTQKINVKVVSSVLILAIFLVAGLKKFNDFKGTQEGITKKITSLKILKNIKIPNVVLQLLTVAVILIEIVAPVAIIYSLLGKENNSKKLMRKVSILTLMLFLIVTTEIYQNPIDKTQMMSFLRNIGMFGALLMMLKYI